MNSLSRVVLFAAMLQTASAQCPAWVPTFTAGGGTSGAVLCSTGFDDGTGPALYIAGYFSQVSATPATNIARWDGTSWSALGAGLANQVNGLAAFDDGFGPGLYACGAFNMAGGAPANRVARWRAGAWSALGSGPAMEDVAGLIVFDDGTGPALYAYGTDHVVSSIYNGSIERFNGTGWSVFATFSGAFGAGYLRDAIVHDDGNGARLYAAGGFNFSAGVTLNDIARWNGSAWENVGAGLSSEFGFRLASFDDGAGPALYASYYGGTATTRNVGRWRGGAWANVAVGMNAIVDELSVHDDGTGQALYACGMFTSIGGVAAAHVARFDGVSWSQVGPGLPTPASPKTLTSLPLGGVPRLFCGGGLSVAGAIGIAQWSSSVWSPLGPPGQALSSYSTALAVHDDGGGPQLFVGGDFVTAGQVLAPHVARWDGAAWSPAASGLDNDVMCFERHDEGAGMRLFAGGLFTHTGAASLNHVARWDGANWTALGTGPGGSVLALKSFDDGSGSMLCAGGNVPGGVVRWNGSAWIPMGAGFNSAVTAFAVWDDGSGPKLYAGGAFNELGGAPISKVVRWDGTNWISVGAPDVCCGQVMCLMRYDDGSGSKLYAGGNFTSIGGTALSGLARFDGALWGPVGGAPSSAAVVSGLTAWDDGSGVALYAVGGFTQMGGVPMPGIARWNGGAWSSVSGSLDGFGTGFAVAAYQPSSLPRADLFVAGSMTSAGGIPANSIAQYGGCGHPGVVVCPGDGSVGACPCGNSGLPGRGCDNSSATGGARLDATGWNSASFDSLVLSTSDQIGFGLCVFVQGDQQFASLPFGDGLLCAGGNLRRLYLKVAVGGSAVAPAAGDPSVSARSASLGDPLSVGATRIYQVYYRDAVLGFCTALPSSTFNLSNALRIGWTL